MIRVGTYTNSHTLLEVLENSYIRNTLILGTQVSSTLLQPTRCIGILCWPMSYIIGKNKNYRIDGVEYAVFNAKIMLLSVMMDEGQY